MLTKAVQCQWSHQIDHYTGPRKEIATMSISFDVKRCLQIQTTFRRKILVIENCPKFTKCKKKQVLRNYFNVWHYWKQMFTKHKTFEKLKGQHNQLQVSICTRVIELVVCFHNDTSYVKPSTLHDIHFILILTHNLTVIFHWNYD